MTEGPDSSGRIAVLPLRNISAQPSDEYFADGLTEELISTLSKIAGWRVIARTSAMRYKEGGRSVKEIARELAVAHVVEGSVRKAGSRVRISVQLLDPATEEHLWTQEYDRDLEDIFRIQSDIAQRIAKALRVEVRRAERRQLERRATANVDAYTLYLEGRFHWNQRSEAGLHRALELFGSALGRDPQFALAQSGIADAYAALALLEYLPPSEAFPKARAASQAAIAIDPNLAEAHASLGLVRFQYDRDWAGAEAELRRALTLNPNYPAGHQFFADYLKAMGRFDEAMGEMRRALDLDPVSLAINTGLGHVLYLSRQYDAAIAQYRKALELDPGFVQAHLWFGRPFLEKGLFTEAIAELRQAVELSSGSTISLAVLAHAYASAGQETEARTILGRLLERSKSTYLPSYWIALIYTGLGEADEALRWLGRAEEERSAWLAWIRVEPRFDRLRSAPGFAALLRRMRLDDESMANSSPSPQTRDRDVAALLAGLEEVRLDRYRVIGSYTRFEPAARHLLKDVRQSIAASFASPTVRNDNFLLWAPPGSGKTFFVREVARSIPGSPDLVEVNLAGTDELEFRARLAEVARRRTPTLCLIDEVDSKPDATWPYEALLPVLERGPAEPSGRVVYVMVGSSGANLEGMRSGIRARAKGTDLLSRVPESNQVELPALSDGDLVLVALATLSDAARSRQRALDEVERLALFYLVTRPGLGNPRQLREALGRALERVPPGEERLKFDHLFVPGDPENKVYWNRGRAAGPELAGAFLRVVS